MDSATEHDAYSDNTQKIDWAMFYETDSIQAGPVQAKFPVQTTSVMETDPNFVQESTSTNNTGNDLKSISEELNKSNEALVCNPDTMDIQQSAPTPYSSIVCTTDSVGIDPVTSLKVNTTHGHTNSKPTPTESEVFKSVMRNRKNASRHRILKKEQLEHQEFTIRVLRVDNDTKDIRIKELTALLEGEKKTVASLRNTVWGRSV